MKYFIIVLLSLISLQGYSSSYIKDARLQMKIHGLMACLNENTQRKQHTVDNESPLTYDKNDISDILAKAAQATGLQWGRYRILQDQETFDIIYNPYNEVSDYFISLSHLLAKEKKIFNPAIGCMYAYETENYQKFIEAMDIYIIDNQDSK